VAAKVASEDHDFRFDIPCLGPQTIATCAQARIAVLAFESGKTLLLDRDEVEKAARDHRITLLSVA
jgi:UDP-2,3-diacylglucosamine hydrolase